MGHLKTENMDYKRSLKVFIFIEILDKTRRKHKHSFWLNCRLCVIFTCNEFKKKIEYWEKQKELLFKIIKMKFTINFDLTYSKLGMLAVTCWICRSWESFVVVHNILTNHRTPYIERSRYCPFCMVRVFVADDTFVTVCCVWNYQGESKKFLRVRVTFSYDKTKEQ